MDQSLGKVAAIFLAAILMFIFPLMVVSQQKDKIAQTEVQSAVVKFVDKVTAEEILTDKYYDNFIAEIQATGNSFDVSFEHQILDVNNAVGKKGVSTVKIGENSYYSAYASQILDYLKTHDTYHLNPGDMFTVEVHNTNKTIGTMFLGFIKGDSQDSFKIVARSTKTVQ